MARIRSIKPEFPQSETIGKLSRDARLLFIQLWTIADDEGRSRAASRMLASLLFPYDDDARELMDGWLDELEMHGCIKRYTVDGDSYLEICNWLKHQKIDHPSPSKIPGFREEFARPRDPLAPDLGKDRIGKDRNKDPDGSLLAREAQKKPKAEVSEVLESCLSRQTAFDLIEHRRQKKAPLTAAAARGLVREFTIFGDPESAAQAMITQGWQGFKPEWMARLANNQPRAGPAGRSNGSSGAIKSFLEGDNDGTRRQESTGQVIPLLPAEWRRD
jgi:hypothetical protein